MRSVKNMFGLLILSVVPHVFAQAPCTDASSLANAAVGYKNASIDGYVHLSYNFAYADPQNSAVTYVDHNPSSAMVAAINGAVAAWNQDKDLTGVVISQDASASPDVLIVKTDDPLQSRGCIQTQAFGNIFYSSAFAAAAEVPGNDRQALRAGKHEFGHILVLNESNAPGSIMQQESGTCGYPNPGTPTDISNADAQSAKACIVVSYNIQHIPPPASPDPPPPFYSYGPGSSSCTSIYDTTDYYGYNFETEQWEYVGSTVDSLLQSSCLN